MQKKNWGKSLKFTVFCKKNVLFHNKLCFKASQTNNSSLRSLLLNKIG